MQINAIQREDLIIHRRNEQEVSRDAFLETVIIIYNLIVLGELLYCVLFLYFDRNKVHYSA